MSNNSPVYWTANGLSLHTRAWSVKSFGGRRFFGPSKRGSDVAMPFRSGRLHVKKTREAQALDISMWVVPLTTDGLRDTALTREQRAHMNWRTIAAAVDVDDEFDIVKRWYDGTTLMVATGRAEYLEGSGPSTDDGTGFFCDFTLTMADPYFYVPVGSQSVGTITVDGEVPTHRVVVTLVSGTNTRVTLPNGNWIQYNGTIGGTPVVIDCLNGNAKIGTAFVNGLITRNPKHPEWFRLTPGVNTITVTGGTASVAYEAAYR